ncbi:hypothetical protein CLF_104875 [Clonorchis sinensis]|uniref:Endonuclease/exonuclease/phosphatase domain-containing protein n=1 Tax=Clonorchis sinensis TaxID=79923 RepID=G7YCH6_CLOSI|nr:hypothetical protein CLF_104875 [Clonorchis sinensis]
MWAKWLSIERETGYAMPHSIDGYSVFRADSKRGRAGGVALYLHAALPIPIVLSDTTPAPFCDALWLQVPLRGSDSLLLGVVYRSPSSPPEDDHFLIRTLGQLSSSYHFTHLLLVGDFNAPKAPWTELQCVGSSGPFAAALTEVVQQSAWTQHVVAPTRYRAGQQPSLLDLVITNERHFVDQVTINAPLGHSDHCVLTFDFICYWARNPEPQTWIRNFCRADFSGMRIFLNQVKLGPASVEDLYRTIVQKVHEADAMYVPKKPARSRTSRKLPKRIRRLLEKRSQLFLKKLTTGDTEDELAFRKMRNRCKSEIRQWNIRKQATILDLARKNRNVLFKYMRHRRRNKPSAFSLRDRNGEPTSDPIVVSEFYRDHYAGDSANSFVMHGEKGPEDITRIDAKKDLGIWLSPNLSFSLHLEKSAQKAFAVLRMIRRTFSRITRTDFQILYGAYVRPLLEYANPVVYSGRTKDVILIERVQRAATKMVAGLKSMDYETRLVVLDLFPLEYRRLRGDLILTYALFEQGLANRFFTVDPANTRRGHDRLFDTLLERLPDGPVSDINDCREKIPKALLRPGTSVCSTTQPTSSKHWISDRAVSLLEARRQIPLAATTIPRRIIRCQVKQSVHADQEGWWTRKAEKMGDNKNAGNVRKLFPVRSTGTLKPIVSEIISDQNGSLISSKAKRLDRCAQYFYRNSVSHLLSPLRNHGFRQKGGP